MLRRLDFTERLEFLEAFNSLVQHFRVTFVLLAPLAGYLPTR